MGKELKSKIIFWKLYFGNYIFWMIKIEINQMLLKTIFLGEMIWFKNMDSLSGTIWEGAVISLTSHLD